MSGFTEVCVLGDLAVGTAKRVIVEGTAIAVVRTDDAVYAIADRCSHADVALSEGEVDGCTIECWLHGSAFDLRTGVPLSLPAIVPVPTFAVLVEGDDPATPVLVDPTPITAPANAG
jgi:3-phenylpropionate/trans-cinnamate dioxygenase ferredoxin subunit